MTAAAHDVIDHLAGGDGSRVPQLRSLRPQAKDNAQRSYEALLEPADPGGFPLRERYAIAAVVAALHGPGLAAELYARNLRDEDPDLADLLIAGDSTGEEHLDAGLEHARLLVSAPAQTGPEHLRTLEDSGWDADAIVTLSQLVAFLTFQLRVAHALGVLAAHPADQEDAR